jgi:hypothetical protein
VGAPSKLDKLKVGFALFQAALILLMLGSYLQRLFQPIQVNVQSASPPPNCCCDDADDGGTDAGSDALPRD